MNKFLKTLLVIINVVILILSLAFIVIEGRLLFAGDWLIYDNPFNGFIRYLFRLFIAVFTFSKAILEFINLNKENELEEYLFYADISILIMALVILILSTNYVGVVCIGISVLSLIIKLLNVKNKYLLK